MAPYDDDLDNIKLVRSKVLRLLLVVVGSLSVALGFIGVFLPILPTTPFLLLAAACYARASPRFYRWLMTNRWFGTYLRDWREGRGVPLRAKVVAVVSIVLTFGISIGFFVPLLPIKFLLVVIGVGVVTHILRLPTRHDD